MYYLYEMGILQDKDKSKNSNREHVVSVKLSQKEWGVLEQKAALYTDGNKSIYIRAALKYFRPHKEILKL